MKRTILIFACALSGISIAVTAALIHLAVFRTFSRSVQAGAAEAAFYIGAALESGGLRYLETLPAGRRLALRITLVDPAGRVLYDTAAPAETLENHGSRPEIAEAMKNGTGKSLRFSETLRKQTSYYAVRLPVSGGAPGEAGNPLPMAGSVLRVSYTTDSIFVMVLNMAGVTLLIAAAVFAAAAIAGSRVTEKLIEPINRIDPDHPGNSGIYEELSPLILRIKRQNEAIGAQMREMRRRQLEFAAITDNMKEGLIVLDQEARILSCNRSARGLLDIHLEHVESQNVLAVRRDEAFRGVLEKALGGTAAEAVFSAGERHLRLFANPVQEGNILQGLVLVILDVTEQEARDRLRREFTANVSHELKTPLMAILGYAEIMAGGLAQTEDMPRFAGNIYRETQRLIRLTGDIMSLSELDEGGVNLSREQVDLFALAETVLQRIRGAASERNLSVSLEGEGTVIQGVRQVLDEVMFNLLDNAVKYNTEGGSIRVLVEKREGAAVFSVFDTGAGIAADEQDRIFERFYRVDKSRSKTVEGTGLGLSIVKHGAALHGAGLELQSGEGGSRFTLRFPAEA
ncbi:MAG: PAS domain-containing protein [Treponema sp.]|jgi:two-component system phosphate regulon sensor histidine kinase PhoR|nr:PAS domain-containing protein [Treponema sp.]